MKFFAFWITLALLAVTVTTAFAKDGTLRKEYTHRTPAENVVQTAKTMHQHKRFALKHPEKMGQLQKRYNDMAHHVRRGGIYAKAAFVQKAQQQNAYQHDCPYQKDAPKSCPMHGDANQMQREKCDMMKADCCK